MFNYNSDLEAILLSRVNAKLLVGYLGGAFSPQKDKLYAATLVDISTIDYDDFAYLHEQVNGHSITNFDPELTKKYISNNSWQYKSTEECIEEGIYQYFSIIFTGIYFEQQWFIIKELCFYGDLKPERDIKENIIKITDYENFWEQSIFRPQEPLTINRDGETITIRRVEMEEFKDNPSLVALLKQGKKEKINRLYNNYIEAEFIVPFFERLRINYSQQYQEFEALRVGYTTIFPEHKSYTLFCSLVKDADKNYALYYFLFDTRTRKFYRWTYFTPIGFDFSFFYGQLIIDDLKQISQWNDIDFLDSSCTMDDEAFWDNYVFARNGNHYTFLEEL
ncbi:hypothetical protein SAMN05428975_2024 [Mucilaginibacter sp. OK268]|uniref:hypothetical protein n=1 Tax=Mucilaginibacter sp. OK268 TaxID=1881048 RepID=UPI00088DC495|nr:hypothetical protein [Mucilaginibacter sp. OK268]SDP60285.1 hypothetical protein SAMN05428975_2024 [Mucilaginibacter sp. OK268]